VYFPREQGMIRRHTIMAATLSALALASCGGGDDNDNSSATPTPTTSPTPTPTASPTYTAFPLTAASEFTQTINAGLSYTGDEAGAVTLGAASTDVSNGRVRLALDPVLATGTYAVLEGTTTDTQQFKNANVVTTSAATNPEIVFRINDTTTAGKFSQLEVLNNFIKDTSTSDTGLQFANTGYAAWLRGDSTTGQKRITYSVFGYPTVATDLPKTGTASYASRVSGRLVSVTGTTTVQRVSGTATVNVNFSTGVIDVTMNLTTQAAGGGAAVAYGTFTAQGALPATSSNFNGSILTGSPLAGTIAGGFFGSQGKEIGITFAGTGTVGGAQQRLVGEIVGKK
jgi:hypothetical protein